MTKIEIFKNKDGIRGYRALGHTDDIVCASVSSLLQGAVVGLHQVAKVDFSVERDEKAGFLRVELVENSQPAQVILETMEASVKNLAHQFPKKITVKENRDEIFD